MPRYVAQCTLPDELALTPGVEQNERDGVTWLHSYVSEDRKRAFCVYDGPSPEAIRKTAARNDFSVDVVIEVRVLDPYMYF